MDINFWDFFRSFFSKSNGNNEPSINVYVRKQKSGVPFPCKITGFDNGIFYTDRNGKAIVPTSWLENMITIEDSYDNFILQQPLLKTPRTNYCIIFVPDMDYIEIESKGSCGIEELNGK